MENEDRSVMLRAPKGQRRVAYGDNDFAFGVDPGGTLNAPRFAVPDLIAEGCERVDGKTEIIDVRSELEAASHGELSGFLASRGIHPAQIPIDGEPVPVKTEDEMKKQALELFDAE